MSCTILLVEDSDDLCELTKLVLEEHGNQVSCARNGREALAWLETHGAPCLILLDLHMPEMSGSEFAEHLISNPAWAEIPVVIMTASTTEKRAPLRARAFLTKPIGLEHVLGITAHCDEHGIPQRVVCDA